jgi:fumarate reductase flavoprotein subunit
VLRAPDEAAIAASIAVHETPFAHRPGDIHAVREALYDLMWDQVGIDRTAASMRGAQERLLDLGARLDGIGVADTDRAFNLTWHDWMNLKNLISISQVIAAAALAREDSRGAHFRSDFPETRDLPGSTYTVVRMQGTDFALTREPVQFNRVRPGESILKEAA